MPYIDRTKYSQLLNNIATRFKKCSELDYLIKDISLLMNNYKNILDDSDVQFASTWLLEKDLWIESEKLTLTPDVQVLSRGETGSC